MKKISLIIAVVVVSTFTANAEVTYQFFNKGGIFDGETSVDIVLTDTLGSTTMTVAGFDNLDNPLTLNSNSTSFGIDNSAIDGTTEVLKLSFSTDIQFTFLDLSAVGSDSADGARLSVGATVIDLFTGVSGFDGTFDEYTPASPINLAQGDFIELTGTSGTSSFDLDAITIIVVPEPSSYAFIAGACGLSFVMVRRRKA